MGFFSSSQDFCHFAGSQGIPSQPSQGYPSSYPDSSRPLSSTERPSLDRGPSPILGPNLLPYARSYNLDSYPESSLRGGTYTAIPASLGINHSLFTHPINVREHAHDSGLTFEQRPAIPFALPWSAPAHAVARAPVERGDEDGEGDVAGWASLPSSPVVPTPTRKQSKPRRKRVEVLRDIKHMVFQHRIGAPTEKIVTQDPKTFQDCIIQKVKRPQYITPVMPLPVLSVMRYRLPSQELETFAPYSDAAQSDEGFGRSSHVRRRLAMTSADADVPEEEPLTFPYTVQELLPGQGQLIGDDGIPWLVNPLPLSGAGIGQDPTTGQAPRSIITHLPHLEAEDGVPESHPLERTFHVRSNTHDASMLHCPPAFPSALHQRSLPALSVMESNAWVMPPPTPVIAPAIPLPPRQISSWPSEEAPTPVNSYGIRRDSLGTTFWEPRPPSSFPTPAVVERSPSVETCTGAGQAEVPAALPQEDVLMSSNLMSALVASVAAPPPRDYACHVCFQID